MSLELFNFRGQYLVNNGSIFYEKISTTDFLEYIFYRSSLFDHGYPFEEELCDEYLRWRAGEKSREEDPHRYNAIALAINTRAKGENASNRNKPYIITKSLKGIDLALTSEFLILSPITYVGKQRTSANARFLYAFAVDLDGVGESQMTDLIHQMNIKEIPIPNIIVNSGHGLHLYYTLQKPIALFADAKPPLGRLKNGLISKVWNMYTSNIKEKQFQGIFQGFRLPGSKTKIGNRVEAYRTDYPNYTITELSRWITNPKYQLTEQEVELLEKGIYNPDRLKLDIAKDKWPEWYERVITRGVKERKLWRVNRRLYDWWLRRISDLSTDEVKEGHRYFCLLALAMYAKKCNVPYFELERDCMSLIERMDRRTLNPENHFTEEDARDALQAYKDDYCTFPRDTISRLTAITIQKNRRNGRTQEEHLKRARAVQKIDYPNLEWVNKQGRPKATLENSRHAQIVAKWKNDNPGNNNKSKCARDTGLSRMTVRKWF